LCNQFIERLQTGQVTETSLYVAYPEHQIAISVQKVISKFLFKV